MARTPFKLRSGNSVPFKQMGSSPVKQEEETYTEELSPEQKELLPTGDIKISQKGVGTTTKPATVKPGKSYSSVGVTEAEGKAYWEANPKEYKKYLASKTTPGEVTTEDISKETVVEKPTRNQRYRYEKPPVIVSGAGGKVDLNIEGKRVRMSGDEYAQYLKTEGYSKGERGGYRRRSTSGKGTLYNPEMVNISEKEGFDYSGIDYSDPTGRQFKNADERQKFMDYQKLLAEAERQEKYPIEK